MLAPLLLRRPTTASAFTPPASGDELPRRRSRRHQAPHPATNCLVVGRGVTRPAGGYSARVLRLVLLGFALLAAPAASGQGFGHPLPPGLRPFHERVAGVDVAALVRVTRVGEGRIEVVREEALAGAAPERFEVKRSPLAPPPLAAGDRALLLLRGERPPYVFADQPSEVIRLEGDAMAARWSDAVRQVVAHRGAPARLVPVYLDWIDEGPATLREIGRSSLLDLAAKHTELRPQIGRALQQRQ
jgi:hypothetical protein